MATDVPRNKQGPYDDLHPRLGAKRLRVTCERCDRRYVMHADQGCSFIALEDCPRCQTYGRWVGVNVLGLTLQELL